MTPKLWVPFHIYTQATTMCCRKLHVHLPLQLHLRQAHTHPTVVSWAYKYVFLRYIHCISGSRISNRKLKVVTIVFATLLLSAFGIALCTNYVWIPLHNLTQSHDVQHREGNVPILLQLSSLLVKKFCVVQEVDLKDSLHTVSVYLPNYGCNELRTTTTTQHYNASTPPPDIPIYMLEHSHISLHTCATTKEDENNPVFFYITKTVEKSINFDGNQKKRKTCNICWNWRLF